MSKPYHETLVTFLRSFPSEATLIELSNFICTTDLPHNHDAVLDAWKNAWRRNGREFYEQKGYFVNVIKFITQEKAKLPTPSYTLVIDPVTKRESWIPVEQPTTDPQTEGK